MTFPEKREHFEEEKVQYPIGDRVEPAVRRMVYGFAVVVAGVLLYIWISL